MTTIIDVARQAQVSPATVSNAFNNPDRLRPETLERVLTVAAEMNFTPNLMAHGLRSQTSGLVGIMVSDIGIQYAAMIAKGAQARLREAQKSGLIINTGKDPVQVRTLMRELVQQGLRAFVMSPSPYRYDEETRELLLEMQSRGIVISFISNELASFPGDVVLWQAQEGAKILVQHLIGLGHRKIGFVRLPFDESTAGLKRWLGYQEGILGSGLPMREAFVFEGDLSFESGVNALDYFLSLEDRPTAIMTVDDHVAAGIINRCYHLGIRVPQDLSVVGFGDLELAQHLSPALTTIGVKVEEMGRQAAELLLRRLVDRDAPPQKPLVDFQMIVRDSTGPLSA